ncbi:MAG TPA: hypothetical protein VHC44_16865 [Verrucomicrobiae bacterium]|nr:hypothetical protein [Verrucomicrobiae bacterium]
MNTLKTILIATFLGAFFLGLGGGLIGGVAGLYIWPNANLGPPVGAIEGAGIGIALGVLGGLIFGLLRVFARKQKARGDDLRNEKGRDINVQL